jgi:hypothetical protein
MMRPRLIAGLALAVLFAAPAWGAATGYVPGTEDVPLMPGLSPVDDTGLIFDKPQGRIIQAAARGAVNRRDVIAFYDSSLPELGWHRADQQHFVRDGERLSLDFDGYDGNLLVDFSLVPH